MMKGLGAQMFDYIANTDVLRFSAYIQCAQCAKFKPQVRGLLTSVDQQLESEKKINLPVAIATRGTCWQPGPRQSSGAQVTKIPKVSRRGTL